MEILHNKAARIAGLALLGALAFSGCSHGAATESEPQSPPPTSQENEFTIHHTYTDDGKRITTYAGTVNGRRVDFDETFAYCDFHDFVEVPNSMNNGLSSTTRIANHPACEDEKLTPSDLES